MPELPDVEILKKYFDRHCLGLKIAEVQVLEKRILRIQPRKDQVHARGQVFCKSRRHGKHLFIEISNDTQTDRRSRFRPARPARIYRCTFRNGWGSGFLENEERRQSTPGSFSVLTAITGICLQENAGGLSGQSQARKISLDRSNSDRTRSALLSAGSIF